MNPQIVEIQPREVKFVFELKKQSTCIVHLGNVTDQYVAFKVKTTSPKKYCVRPNVGVIKPKSTCDFTVTMQAQKLAPSEQCKDKFLVQSTVVRFGTTEEDITPSMFSKGSQKYIEETKLRVILTSAPSSPEKPLADVVLNQEVCDEYPVPKEPHAPVLLPVHEVIKQEPSFETFMPKDKLKNGVEYFSRPDMLLEKVEAIQNVKKMEEPRSLKVVENVKPVPAKDEEFYLQNKEELYPQNKEELYPQNKEELYFKKNEEFYPKKNEEFHPKKNEELKQDRDVEDAKLKLTEDIGELRSKISAMNAKLVEAEYTIEKLKAEKTTTIYEKEKLKQELAISKTKSPTTRRIQVGFPPLFVCMVALISLVMGSLFRA
ncbi:hypothetical protein ABFS83_07G020100 [Erythranthe nasuta]